MTRRTYNKLVRDKIPQIIAKDKAIAKTRILNEKAFFSALTTKLFEEAHEVLAAKDVPALIQEIADMVEVLRALAKAKGVSWRMIERVRLQKLRKRGGFTKRIFLVDVRELNSSE